jgi:hypothetical protein
MPSRKSVIQKKTSCKQGATTTYLALSNHIAKVKIHSMVQLLSVTSGLLPLLQLALPLALALTDSLW